MLSSGSVGRSADAPYLISSVQRAEKLLLGSNALQRHRARLPCRDDQAPIAPVVLWRERAPSAAYAGAGQSGGSSTFIARSSAALARARVSRWASDLAAGDGKAAAQRQRDAAGVARCGGETVDGRREGALQRLRFGFDGERIALAQRSAERGQARFDGGDGVFERSGAAGG